ncbi:putative glutathione s-transferase protein [Botrytis fragariae]|uniref:Putative glutathione s-transferase protein n=1 Tax=Botrytis fragariae TaxID=1964551 RepID=A0A8H6ANT5_9HELO|nr:putative glutathione s-transferase protein [Botrytis fragariae]KAF5870625.1 putative glutathione s-transferase protein [Botrytis fragariae]
MTFPPYDDKTPLDVKNATGLHLVTENTPNGQKVQILLEELADVYGTEWTTTLLDTSTNEQKKDWFLRLNPNGRIPIIIDNTQSPPFPLMETSAELLYLLRLDKDHQFGLTDELEQSELLQWLFFWHGSGAPYQGNFRFFSRAEEQSSFAINRFRKETYRVYGVLELQLSGKYTGQPKEFLAGKDKGKYSIADIGTWAWVKNWPGSGFTEKEMKEFPSLLEWIERIAERPAVKRGIGEKYVIPQ